MNFSTDTRHKKQFRIQKRINEKFFNLFSYILIVFFLLIFGCQTDYEKIYFQSPIISCKELYRKNGLVYKKNELFTGRTIEYYKDLGFEVTVYIDGAIVRPYNLTKRPKLPHDKTLYKDAIREYIDSGSPLDLDCFIFLTKNGTERDIPILIESLKNFSKPVTGKIDYSKNFCLEALKKITGANPGNEYSDWIKWYNAKHN